MVSKQEVAPTVSVLMATYNCRDSVDAALESIAEQSFADWEFILCDDASTDGTYERLVLFQTKHPGRVTTIRNQTNSKLAFSLNRCLEHASGRYIARMDGDDVSKPNRLLRQVTYLESHPDVDLVGTAMQRFDDTGLKDVLSMEPNPNWSSLRHGVPFAHATVMARRQVFETLGGYTVARRTERGQDRDLWFRFIAAGFIGHNFAEPLYLVREDDQAIRRRTFAARWGSFRTTMIGFQTLGYPARWYVRPVIGLLKALAPVPVIRWYRRLEHLAYRRRVANTSTTT